MGLPGGVVLECVLLAVQSSGLHKSILMTCLHVPSRGCSRETSRGCRGSRDL